MIQNQRESNDNKQKERHTSSQKYFLNRLKFRSVLVMLVFGYLFGGNMLKSYEAEPLMLIFVLIVIGSLAEFIPPNWVKPSSKEDKIDWNGFIKMILGYSILFVVGLVIGFMSRTR